MDNGQRAGILLSALTGLDVAETVGGASRDDSGALVDEDCDCVRTVRPGLLRPRPALVLGMTVATEWS